MLPLCQGPASRLSKHGSRRSLHCLSFLLWNSRASICDSYPSFHVRLERALRNACQMQIDARRRDSIRNIPTDSLLQNFTKMLFNRSSAHGRTIRIISDRYPIHDLRHNSSIDNNQSYISSLTSQQSRPGSPSPN